MDESFTKMKALSLSDFSISVEHLISEKTEIVHVTRIRPYADFLTGTSAQIRDIAEF